MTDESKSNGATPLPPASGAKLDALGAAMVPPGAPSAMPWQYASHVLVDLSSEDPSLVARKVMKAIETKRVVRDQRADVCTAAPPITADTLARALFRCDPEVREKLSRVTDVQARIESGAPEDVTAADFDVCVAWQRAWDGAEMEARVRAETLAAQVLHVLDELRAGCPPQSARRPGERPRIKRDVDALIRPTRSERCAFMGHPVVEVERSCAAE